MKKIFYSILVAGLALVSASCQKTEEQFINQAPVSGKSLTVTGSIAGFEGTKVNYEFSDPDKPKSGIKASWAEGDIIFGFDDKDGTFEFKVTDIKDGKAIFSDISGGNGYTPAQDVSKLYAVYYPGEDHSFSEGKLDVDLSSQNGTLGSLTPAIMCATGTINNGCVHFDFSNQTAIVGIYKMQIFDGGTPVGENVEISSVTLNNVNTTGTIKCYGENNENFGLVPDIEEFGDITAEFKDGEKLVPGENGIIEVTSSALKPYFAVIPSNDNDVNFTVTASDGTKEYSTTGLITGKLPAGTYTYVGKKMDIPVASITETGAKYFTISDAFKAANDGETIKLEQDCEFDNEVTLSDKSGNVTLNLNGHTLTNKGNNRINLNNADATLTIEGGKSLGAEEDGTITSNNPNAAVIKVTEGDLVVNSGEILVNDSNETTASGKSAIWVQNTAANPPAASVTINGGKITGSSNAPKDNRCYALYVENTNASVSITSGTFSSQSNNLRIIKASSVNITGGTFNAPTSSGEYTIRLAGDYTCNIGSNSGSEEIVVNGVTIPVYISSGTINLNVYSGRYSTSSSTANIISRASGNSSPINVYGGLFPKEVNEAYLAPGYGCVENEDATTKDAYPHIVERTAAGHFLVNGESKDTWNDAVTAVNESTTDVTIILLDNIEISDYVTIKNASKKTTTLDLNGCKITRIGEQTRTIYSETDLVVNDSKGNGEIEAYGNAVYVDGAKLTVNGGNFSGNGYGTSGGTAVVMAINSGSQLTINGGTITCTNSSNVGRAINTNATKVDINGGNIICNDSDGYAVRAYGSANIVIDGNACIYSTSSVAPINGSESNAKIYFRNGYVYSSGSATILNNSSRVIVTGGYFNKTLTAKSGYGCVGCSVTGPDGRTYNQKVQSSDPVAKVTIGGGSSVDYYSFEEALAAAKQVGSNATIQLQSNVELFKSTDFTNDNGKKITVDLNNNTLESTGVRNMITTTGELDITDKSTDKGGKIKGTVNRVIYLTTAGKINVSNIVIETSATNYTSTIDSSAIVVHGTSSANSAEFSANNTTIRTADGNRRTTLMAVYYGTIKLSDCVITQSKSGNGWYVLKTSNGAQVTISRTSMYTPNNSNIHCMAAANAKIDIDNSWFYTQSGNFNFSASAQTTYDSVITASNCYFNTDIVGNPGNWNAKEGEEKKSISEISHAHSDSDIGDLHYSYAVAPQ